MNNIIKIERVSETDIDCGYYGTASISYYDYYFNDSANKDDVLKLFKQEIKKGLTNLAKQLKSELTESYSKEDLEVLIKTNNNKIKKLKEENSTLKKALKIINNSDSDINKRININNSNIKSFLYIVNENKDLLDKLENITDRNNRILYDFDFIGFNYGSDIISNNTFESIVLLVNIHTDDFYEKLTNYDASNIFENSGFITNFCEYLVNNDWIRLSDSTESFNNINNNYYDSLYKANELEHKTKKETI